MHVFRAKRRGLWGRIAPFYRFSPGGVGRSPGTGTIERFFCARRPKYSWVSKFRRRVMRIDPDSCRSADRSSSRPIDRELEYSGPDRSSSRRIPRGRADRSRAGDDHHPVAIASWSTRAGSLEARRIDRAPGGSLEDGRIDRGRADRSGPGGSIELQASFFKPRACNFPHGQINTIAKP